MSLIDWVSAETNEHMGSLLDLTLLRCALPQEERAGLVLNCARRTTTVSSWGFREHGGPTRPLLLPQPLHHRLPSVPARMTVVGEQGREHRNMPPIGMAIWFVLPHDRSLVTMLKLLSFKAVTSVSR